MAAGDKYFDCSKAPSLEQAMRLMFKEDENGGPMLPLTPQIPAPEGFAAWEATPIPAELMYNDDAGVQHVNDESPVFEFYAINDVEGNHTGDAITVHVPDNLEIQSVIDSTWHTSDFAHVLGDGTGADPAAALKCRLRNGLSVGTSSDEIKITHPNFTPNTTVLTIDGRVHAATHASVISWQTALTGEKPSGVLIYNLDNLITGLEADEDLVEMDYLHMVRGMETDEQRLKPLKSNAGVDADLIGSGAAPAVFDRTGIKITVNTQKTIRFKWKPITNGVKATQNNNVMFCTYNGLTSAAGNLCGFSNTGNIWQIGKNAGSIFSAARSWTSGFATGQATATNGYSAVYRISSTEQGMHTNGSQALGSAATSGVTGDFFGRMPGSAPGSDTGNSVSPHLAVTMHCFGVGSNSINHVDVRARFNTYYAGLGLSAV